MGLTVTACKPCEQCDFEKYGAGYAEIGAFYLYKRNDTYTVIYQSSIDFVKTEGSMTGTFNLTLIKNVVNAGVNEKQPEIFVRRGCFDGLRHAYTTIDMEDTPTYKHDYTDPIFHCDVYGSYLIAITTYDKDLYDSTMIYRVPQWQSELNRDDKAALVPLVNR